VEGDSREVAVRSGGERSINDQLLAGRGAADPRYGNAILRH
jgi:hypothetical protein